MIIASNTSSNLTFLPVRVHQLIENGDHKRVIDSTPDKLYLKKHAAGGGGADTQETQSITNTVHNLPKSCWGKDLSILPPLNDISIEEYTLQSGKKVDRRSSETAAKVCLKTCIKIENTRNVANAMALRHSDIT